MKAYMYFISKNALCQPPSWIKNCKQNDFLEFQEEKFNAVHPQIPSAIQAKLLLKLSKKQYLKLNLRKLLGFFGGLNLQAQNIMQA